MAANELLQNMIRFLNFPEDAPFETMRDFLQKAELCRYELILSEDDQKSYSLYTKQEVLARRAEGLPVGLWLTEAATPIDENKTYTLLTDPAFARERVVFPEPGDNSETGGIARFRQAFRSALTWFQNFMAGCAAGSMDIETLNTHKTSRKLIMEFRPSKDPMNPILAPIGMSEDELDGDIKRRMLAVWVYPFIFAGNGRELSKVRRCQHCGTYFLGQRVSATFCTSKCRMAHYYANRA